MLPAIIVLSLAGSALTGAAAATAATYVPAKRMHYHARVHVAPMMHYHARVKGVPMMHYHA